MEAWGMMGTLVQGHRAQHRGGGGVKEGFPGRQHAVSFERQVGAGDPPSFFHDSKSPKSHHQVLGGRPSSIWFKSVSSMKRPSGFGKLPPVSGHRFPSL